MKVNSFLSDGSQQQRPVPIDWKLWRRPTRSLPRDTPARRHPPQDRGKEREVRLLTPLPRFLTIEWCQVLRRPRKPKLRQQEQARQERPEWCQVLRRPIREQPSLRTINNVTDSGSRPVCSDNKDCSGSKNFRENPVQTSRR